MTVCREHVRLQQPQSGGVTQQQGGAAQHQQGGLRLLPHHLPVRGGGEGGEGGESQKEGEGGKSQKGGEGREVCELQTSQLGRGCHSR